LMRGAASKVMWVGRATVFLVGLAVILALVFGLASAALGANGQPFLLGKGNDASNVSKLTRSEAGPALSLRVQGGEPPLKFNSGAQVNNLNADELDGNHAAACLGSGVVVRTDETDLEDGPLGASFGADCEEDEVATGGGGAVVVDGAPDDAAHEDGFDLLFSRPDPQSGEPTGWEVGFFDADAGEPNGLFTVRVYAVCTNVGADAATPE
jgi:hypothetical protein